MVDFSSNWVDFGTFFVGSILFAELYTRIKVAWWKRRIVGALISIRRGESTKDALLFQNASQAILGALAGQILEKGEDDRWHLTKTARILGTRALTAIGELVKIRGPAGGSGLPIGGLDLGALDMDQLVGVGISMLPKKQQGLAAMLAGVGLPLLKQFTGGGGLGAILGGKTSTSKKGELVNPLLKELGK